MKQNLFILILACAVVMTACRHTINGVVIKKQVIGAYKSLQYDPVLQVYKETYFKKRYYLYFEKYGCINVNESTYNVAVVGDTICICQ